MANDVPISAGVGTNVETLQQADADLSHRQVVHVADFLAFLHLAVQQLANPAYVDPANQRMRISIENIAGTLTLSTITTVGTITTVTTVATVTTVGTVTNLANIGGRPADEMIVDGATSTWANALRGRVQ